MIVLKNARQWVIKPDAVKVIGGKKEFVLNTVRPLAAFGRGVPDGLDFSGGWTDDL